MAAGQIWPASKRGLMVVLLGPANTGFETPVCACVCVRVYTHIHSQRRGLRRPTPTDAGLHTARPTPRAIRVLTFKGALCA